MSNKRLGAILSAMTLLGITAFAIRTATATSLMTLSTTGIASSAVRSPSGAVPLGAVEASDWYDRHPGSTIPAEGVASDWFERHPEIRTITSAVDLSDYFLRHPTMPTVGNADAPDDYFQRHPDSLHPGNRMNLVTPVDRYPESILQRHPELLEQVNPTNLSDSIQRHRDRHNR